MAKQNPNLLLVEGKEEQYTLPFFMDHYVVWGDKKKKEKWVVEIRQFDGVENLLEPGVIEAESKTPGLNALGIIIDANDSFESRWANVRNRCQKAVPSFPNELPPEGLIHITPDRLRIGVWIMPDNGSRGMLETFFGILLVAERVPLWDAARESCDRAFGIYGCYREAHRDKAHIHTYLAWADPPGLPLPRALLEHVLDARLPAAAAFARWFIELFQLAPRATSSAPESTS
ncbi:MAG: DUF3226 domain-containing protein [Isosphaeraceae bacterium]